MPQQTVRVINITSLSFTGTSWLNTLLGCHFDGFAMGPPDRFDSLFASDPSKLCLVHGAQCSFWPQFCREYDLAQNFFVQFMNKTGKRIVAINNPIPAPKGFGRHLEHPQVETKRVFMVRDGRAVAASYARHLKVPFEKAVKEWFRPAIEGMIALQRSDGGPVIRHEDAMADPGKALATVGTLMGITYPPNAPRYWEFDHHLVAANSGMVALIRLHHGLPLPNFADRDFYEQQYKEAVAGGSDSEAKFNDERWKTELTAADRAMFDEQCGRFNQHFGYERDRGSVSIWTRIKEHPQSEQLVVRPIRGTLSVFGRAGRKAGRVLNSIVTKK